MFEELKKVCIERLENIIFEFKRGMVTADEAQAASFDLLLKYDRTKEEMQMFLFCVD